MKEGDKVTLVSTIDETDKYAGFVGRVGTVIKVGAGETKWYRGEFADINFGHGTILRPWVKNLRPAKEYYLKKFKELYERR